MNLIPRQIDRRTSVSRFMRAGWIAILAVVGVTSIAATAGRVSFSIDGAAESASSAIDDGGSNMDAAIAAGQSADSDALTAMDGDASPFRHVGSASENDDDDVAGLDHDSSFDYLTAELPEAFAGDLDFSHIASHGLTRETVFAVPLPRCVPTAIP